MRPKALIAAAMLLEPLGWAVTLEARGRWALALFAGVHGAAAACAALGLTGLLPARARSGPRDALVLAALGFFIPFAGVPGLLLCAVRALWPPRKAAPGPPLRILDFPELPPSPIPDLRPSPFADTYLAAALRHGREPALRLRAVLAAGRMREPTAVALLSEALRDRDDEVRLLAYALLDRTEREIYAHIKEDLARLEREPPEARAQLHARLAQHHWELVYLGLAQGDVAAHLLSTAAHHADVALALDPKAGGAHLLKGRILLARGELAEAEAAFGRAIACGLGDEVVRPYLAEVAFRRRRFQDVRAHLEPLGPGRRGTIPPRVAAFWS